MHFAQRLARDKAFERFHAERELEQGERPLCTEAALAEAREILREMRGVTRCVGSDLDSCTSYSQLSTNR